MQDNGIDPIEEDPFAGVVPADVPEHLQHPVVEGVEGLVVVGVEAFAQKKQDRIKFPVKPLLAPNVSGGTFLYELIEVLQSRSRKFIDNKKLLRVLSLGCRLSLPWRRRMASYPVDIDKSTSHSRLALKGDRHIGSFVSPGYWAR